ncbi:MAG: UDP-N-acetylglucosamine 2-epimerase, partial [Bacteroidota bacterium]
MKDNNLKQIAVILGIRPDIIRASQIIKLLKADKRINTVFIWSGQHYSDNLKDIFFREFEVPKPDVELDCKGESDAQITSQLISKLNEVFLQVHPEAAIFLGDTNTVIGCLAAAQLNIPIIHIEGCMRSYDWRMPEEKNRTIIDHLSDIIYTYLKEYKEQGIKEGLNPQNIMVVGNPIVDIINTFFLGKNHNSNIDAKQLAEKGLTKNSFYLMTCHRRENVHDEKSFSAIIELASQAPYPVYFPASYRTQKIIKEMKIELPKSIIQVDPIGYKEFMLLMTNS